MFTLRSFEGEPRRRIARRRAVGSSCLLVAGRNRSRAGNKRSVREGFVSTRAWVQDEFHHCVGNFTHVVTLTVCGRTAGRLGSDPALCSAYYSRFIRLAFAYVASFATSELSLRLATWVAR